MELEGSDKAEKEQPVNFFGPEGFNQEVGTKEEKAEADKLEKALEKIGEEQKLEPSVA